MWLINKSQRYQSQEHERRIEANGSNLKGGVRDFISLALFLFSSLGNATQRNRIEGGRSEDGQYLFVLLGVGGEALDVAPCRARTSHVDLWKRGVSQGQIRK